MQITFKTSELEDMYYEDKNFKGYNPLIIEEYRDSVAILKNARDIRDIYALTSLHCEKLQGKLEGKWSIRLNKKRRLLFSIDKYGEINIVCIEELSNHYQ